MEAWEPLFDKAMQVLDSLPKRVAPPHWTFGGGTVLMRKYHHRLSRDVDIFLTDAQHLTLFSPRLNDAMAEMATQYREDSQHVKWRRYPRCAPNASACANAKRQSGGSPHPGPPVRRLLPCGAASHPPHPCWTKPPDAADGRDIGPHESWQVLQRTATAGQHQEKRYTCCVGP